MFSHDDLPLPTQAKYFLSNIDKQTSNAYGLDQFESLTGLPRSYAVLGAGGVYLLLIFLNLGGIGQFLSNIAGFVIPGYFSLIALETSGKDDDTQLLTYWVVFAFLNVIEFWSKAILYWVPFYFLFKTFFLLYIGIPSFGGARSIYVNVIQPFSRRFVLPRSNIANDINSAASGVSSSVEL